MKNLLITWPICVSSINHTSRSELNTFDSLTVFTPIILAGAACFVNTTLAMRLNAVIKARPLLQPPKTIMVMTLADLIVSIASLIIYTWSRLDEISPKFAVGLSMLVWTCRTFTIWCWCVLAAQRYLAMMRPHYFHTVNVGQLQHAMLFSAFMMAVVMQCSYISISGIMNIPQLPFMTLEAAATMMLPFIFTISLDMLVNCRQQRRLSVETRSRSRSQQGATSSVIQPSLSSRGPRASSASGRESVPTVTFPPPTVPQGESTVTRVEATVHRPLPTVPRTPTPTPIVEAPPRRKSATTDDIEEHLARSRNMFEKTANSLLTVDDAIYFRCGDGQNRPRSNTWASQHSLHTPSEPISVSPRVSTVSSKETMLRSRHHITSKTLRKYLFLITLDICMNLPAFFINIYNQLIDGGELCYSSSTAESTETTVPGTPEVTIYGVLTLLAMIGYHAQFMCNVLHARVLFPSMCRERQSTMLDRNTLDNDPVVKQRILAPNQITERHSVYL